MITAGNIQYELADRVQGLACGGIGAMLLVARTTGLIGQSCPARAAALGTVVSRVSPRLSTSLSTPAKKNVLS